MRVLREWIHRVRGTLQGVRRDPDLEEELRLHMELAADEAHRRGETPQEAARAARLRAGGVSQAVGMTARQPVMFGTDDEPRPYLR